MFRTPIADALAEGLKIQSADETILRMAQTIAALHARVAEMEAKAAVFSASTDMLRAERDALDNRIDDLTKFLAECCLERDALRAKNKALAQQFLDADAYVVELRARVAELERLGKAADDRIAQLEAALKAVEWRGIPSEDERCCPECDQEKSLGHVPDCLVGKALKPC